MSMSSTNHEVAATRQSLGDLTNADQEERERQRLLLFTRVLMNYLKENDRSMRAKAIAVVKECCEEKSARDLNYPFMKHPNYQSLATIMEMKARLQETVGEHYWKKANQRLNRFLKRRRENTDLLIKEGLMRYLKENHLKEMHGKALAALKQCSDDYSYDTESHPVRKAVGEEIWDKGHQYFRHYLRMTMNPSPAINNLEDFILYTRPKKRLRCDELPTSFDLVALVQGSIGETILSYASGHDLCALDLVNKKFKALTKDQWKVVTKDRFGMDNGKEDWKVGTSFLRSPVFVHDARGGAPVGDHTPHITANENIVVDVSNEDDSFRNIWIRDASDLEYITNSVSSTGSNIMTGKVSICGQVGKEIIVTSNSRKICAQIGGIGHYHVQKWEYDERNYVCNIETLGSETHLIVAHNGKVQLYEVNEQPEYLHDEDYDEEGGEEGTPIYSVFVLRKEIEVEEGAADEHANGVVRGMKLSWAPDKTHFIVGYPHQICVWKFDAANNNIILVKTIDVPDWGVTNVALAEDYIVASSKNKKVHIWNRSTGDKMVYGLQGGTTARDALCDVPGVTLGPRSRNESGRVPLSLSCHGHILVSTSHVGCALCVWDMKTGELLKRHNEAKEESGVKMLNEGGRDVTDMVHLEKLNAYLCVGLKENMWAFPTNLSQLVMAQSIRRHKDMFPKYKAFRTWVE